MIVSKTVSLELEDLYKIQERLKDGNNTTFSEFVQNAIKNELKNIYSNSGDVKNDR